MHSTRVFTPVMPYCRRADVIVGGPFRKTDAIADISGKPTTLALQMYLPAVSVETAIVKFGEVPTTFGTNDRDGKKSKFLSIIHCAEHIFKGMTIMIIDLLYHLAHESRECLAVDWKPHHSTMRYLHHYRLPLISVDF